MTQIARRAGWHERRRLRVFAAKAPEGDGAPQDGLDDAYTIAGYDDYYPYVCDEDWAVPVMSSMVFEADGLVHVSRPKDPTSACGEAGNWPIPSMGSTDEAIAYAREHRGDFRTVTCVGASRGRRSGAFRGSRRDVQDHAPTSAKSRRHAGEDP